MPSPDPFSHARLDGKVGVVTGAAQGIGEAAARLFVARGMRKLLLVDRRGDRLEAVAESLRAQGASVETMVLDLADGDAVDTVMPAVDRAFGRIDVLANVAGLTDRGRDPAQRPGDVGQLHAQQERHRSTLGDGGDEEVSVDQGAGFVASRCRSPVARTARRSIAARTSSGEPTTTTRFLARVIAV